MFPNRLQTAEDLTAAFRNWNELLYKYIYVRLREQELAEDMTQTVFLKAWEHRESFDAEKSSLKNWLFVIATNTLRDHYRTQKPPAEELNPELHSDFDLKAEIRQKDLRDFVLEKLKNLPERDQELVTLRYVEDLAVKEIAVILEMEYSATKVALHRALKKLQEICREKS